MHMHTETKTSSNKLFIPQRVALWGLFFLSPGKRKTIGAVKSRTGGICETGVSIIYAVGKPWTACYRSGFFCLSILLLPSLAFAPPSKQSSRNRSRDRSATLLTRQTLTEVKQIKPSRDGRLRSSWRRWENCPRGSRRERAQLACPRMAPPDIPFIARQAHPPSRKHSGISPRKPRYELLSALDSGFWLSPCSSLSLKCVRTKKRTKKP
jgi:hypothetical protein